MPSFARAQPPEDNSRVSGADFRIITESIDMPAFIPAERRSFSSRGVCVVVAAVFWRIALVAHAQGGLGNIDTSAGVNGIVPLPQSVSASVRNRFNRYTKILAPNGNPIHLLAQSNVSDAHLLRARRIMAFYLADFPGSQYGADKSAVANHMANQNACFTYCNSEQSFESAMDSSFGDLDLFVQPLWVAESPLPGSVDYNDNDPRDAAFEEIFHLVHGGGIQPVLTAYQSELVAAAGLGWNNGSGGVWTPDLETYQEWAAEGSVSHEYIISVIDVYYGYWAYNYSPGNYVSFDDEYQVNRRQDLAARDPAGLAVLVKFLPPYLGYREVIDPGFSGVFKLIRDPALDYTHKSRYLDHAELTGSNGSGLIGNERDNELWGNSGDNSFTGSGGNDQLNGQNGTDTAVYSGARSEYTLSIANGIVTVEDTLPDRDGTDTLEQMELLQFSDGSVEVSSIGVSLSGQWRQAWFSAADLNNAALEATLWGWSADPDNDGVKNIVEYATGTDPLVAHDLPGMTLGLEAGALVLTTYEITGDPALIFGFQVSSDLMAWTDAVEGEGGDFQTLGRESAGTGRERVRTQFNVPPASAHRFIRAVY